MRNIRAYVPDPAALRACRLWRHFTYHISHDQPSPIRYCTYLDRIAPLLQALLHPGVAVHEHLHHGRRAEGGALEVLGIALPRRRRAEGGEAGLVEGVARVGIVQRGGGGSRGGGYRLDLHVGNCAWRGRYCLGNVTSTAATARSFVAT